MIPQRPILGVLMLETRFPRIPGDVGNPKTYPFPVILKKIKGANLKTVVIKTEPSLLKSFIQGAKELEQEGVKAITTSCGFTVLFQDEMAKAVKIPVFTSSLIMIPMIFKMLMGRIGIITANSLNLSKSHLKAAGALNIPTAIKGLEDKSEFKRVILEDSPNGDMQKIEAEVVQASRELLEEHPDVKGIVLECHNLPPYREKIKRETKLPIFDFISLTKFVYSAVRSLGDEP